MSLLNTRNLKEDSDEYISVIYSVVCFIKITVQAESAQTEIKPKTTYPIFLIVFFFLRQHLTFYSKNAKEMSFSP